jgi:hypothetical protein
MKFGLTLSTNSNKLPNSLRAPCDIDSNSDNEIIITSKKALYINSYGSYNSISEISSKEPLNNVNLNQEVNELNSNNKQGNKWLKRKIERENTVY